jgi:hypothetical protein
MTKLPVFFHIPKNAGTYISDSIWFMMDKYWFTKLCEKYDSKPRRFKGSLKTINIVDKDNEVNFIVYGYDHLSDSNNYNVTYSLEAFLEYTNEKSLEIFAIIIKTFGFSLYQNLLNALNENEFIKFGILRDPFTQENSFYNYLTGNESSHEEYHMIYKSKTFIEFLNSNELEDCRLMRYFLGSFSKSKTPILNEEHFNSTCDILDELKLADIKNTDQLLNEVFMECYNLNLDDIREPFKSEKQYINKNQSKKPKIKIEDVDDETLNRFKEKAKYSYKIYNRYIN